MAKTKKVTMKESYTTAWQPTNDRNMAIFAAVVIGFVLLVVL